jgi:hypothetical protein
MSKERQVSAMDRLYASHEQPFLVAVCVSFSGEVDARDRLRN